MHFRHRQPWLAMLTIALGLGFAGCSDEEGGDTRNMIEIISLNQNTVLNSDVWRWIDPKDPSKGGFIPLELVEVTFRSRPHDGALSIRPGEPFGSVRFHQYDVVWKHPTDKARTKQDGVDFDGNGSVDLKNFSWPMNTVVATGLTGTGNIQLVSFEAKARPPVWCLSPFDFELACSVNGEVEYAAIGTLTFHGIEETSGDAITLTRSIPVVLADLYDD